MPAVSQPPALREEDYEAIESAVMETTRGRWFLSEYARRNRNADTEVLLSAIGQLEGLMKTERKGPKLERIQLDLADMAEAITRTKREIAQIKTESNDGDRFAEASSELDAIVTQTEGATQDILQKAELVQEIAWTLREQGVDEASCDAIDAHTTDIFMACSFQDLTGQRTQKVVQVLRYLESRINEMMEIWGVDANEMKVDVGPINPEDHRPDRDLLHGPQSTDKAIKQNTVDELMDSGVQYMSDDDDPMSAGEATSEATTDINEIEFDAIEVDTEEADAEEGSAEEAAAETDATGDINVDEIVFDAIEQEVSESEESAAAEPDVSPEASSDASAAEDAAADMTVDEQSGEIDFDSISFDKIDSEDADVDEATAEDAPAQEEAPAAQEDTSEETSVSLADMEAPEGAQNVLEELLDASDDDETALDTLAQEGDESAEEAIDAAADEAVSEAADQATDESESSMDEAEEAEADADAAFLDMEQTADQEDEADESDPLRAMSAGERLALFN